jgi:NitT/TauT family transport system substrate-binding protein
MPLSRRNFLKIGGVGSLGASTIGRASADDLKVVRAITVPSDAAKQILYPQRANLFRRQGIQVELSSMASGAAIFAAIVGGSADVGTGSLFPVFTAYGHGIPLRIIAPSGVYSTDKCDTWLLVRKDSLIHTPRDLNGKIMGAPGPDDIFVHATRVWLDEHGGDGKSLRPIELTSSEQLAALTAGRVDAVVLRPPYLTVAMQSGNVRVLGKPLDVIAPHFLVSVWVATADYIAANANTVKAFVAGLAEGARYTNAHPNEAAQMVAQFSGQDASLLEHGVRSVTGESITLSDVQKPLDFAYKHGVIDQHFDAQSVVSSSALLPRDR